MDLTDLLKRNGFRQRTGDETPPDSITCKKQNSLDEVVQNIPSDSNNGVSLKLLQCHIDRLRFPDIGRPLKVLNLHRCSFKVLPSAAFKNLPALERLTVTECDIETLRGDAFAGAASLTDLSLTHNRIGDSPAELDLDGLASLRNLDLRNNGIGRIDALKFQNLDRLLSLNLSCNAIAEIPPRLFANLARLRRLCLHNNRIASIDAEAFAGLHNLPVLYLEGNAFRGLPRGVLFRLTSLEMLTLDSNPIESLDHVSFLGLSKLQCLNLSNDERLTELRAHSFADLPQIGVLNLDHNAIADVDVDAFKGLNGLVRLNLSHNRIRRVPEGAFNDAVEMLDLDLSSNKIELLEAKTFFRLFSLASLSLRRNRLRTLEAGAFRPLLALTCLDLGSNKLESVEGGAFDHLPTLKLLKLDDNRLKRVAEGAFRELADLAVLDLSCNCLESFDGAALFGGGNKLQELCLQGNCITSLDVEGFASFGHLRVVRLNGNKLNASVMHKMSRKYRSVDHYPINQRL